MFEFCQTSLVVKWNRRFDGLHCEKLGVKIGEKTADGL
jgi:hypothetical protein